MKSLKQQCFFFTLLAIIQLNPGCDRPVDTGFADGNLYTNQADHLIRFTQRAHLDNADLNNIDGELPETGDIVASADLNGDRFDDLIIYHKNLQVVQVGVNASLNINFNATNPDIYFGWLDPLLVPKGGMLLLGDLDSDKAMELAIVDSANKTIAGYDLRRMPNESIPFKLVPLFTQTIDCLGTASSTIALADINKDGRADLLCREEDQPRKDLGNGLKEVNPTGHLKVYLMQSDDQFGPPIANILPCEGCRSWQCFGRECENTPYEIWRFGDIDGDGHLDIVAVRQFSSDLVVNYGDGAGHFVQKTLIKSAIDSNSPQISVPPIPILGDMDGDGNIDILWHEIKSIVTSPELEYSQFYFTPTIFYGSSSRQLEYQQSVEVNLGFLTAWGFEKNFNMTPNIFNPMAVSDVNSDGLKEIIQIGPDQDFGLNGPIFVRILTGNRQYSQLMSNTQLSNNLINPTELVGNSSSAFQTYIYRITTGDFAGKGSQQVMVINQKTSEYWLYEWNP